MNGTKKSKFMIRASTMFICVIIIFGAIISLFETKSFADSGNVGSEENIFGDGYETENKIKILPSIETVATVSHTDTITVSFSVYAAEEFEEIGVDITGIEGDIIINFFELLEDGFKIEIAASVEGIPFELSYDNFQMGYIEFEVKTFDSNGISIESTSIKLDYLASNYFDLYTALGHETLLSYYNQILYEQEHISDEIYENTKNILCTLPYEITFGDDVQTLEEAAEAMKNGTCVFGTENMGADNAFNYAKNPETSEIGTRAYPPVPTFPNYNDIISICYNIEKIGGILVIQGRIDWCDPYGNTIVHPAQKIKVDVYREWWGPNYTLDDSQYTDSNGRFAFIIEDKGYEIYILAHIEIYDQYGSDSNHKRIRVVNNGNFNYQAKSINIDTSNLSGYSFPVGNYAHNTEETKAIAIAEPFVEGLKYVRNMTGGDDLIGYFSLPVVYPSPQSFFMFPIDAIYIDPADDFRFDETVLHEFGHYISEKLGIIDTNFLNFSSFFPGSHWDTDNLADTQIFGKYVGIHWAWSEGWAHYFSSRARGESKSDVNSGRASCGEANELTVFRVLANLYHDGIYSEQEIWDFAKNNNCSNLSAFINVLYIDINNNMSVINPVTGLPNRSFSDVGRIGKILEEHNGAAITSGNRSTYTSSIPLVLNWTAPRGSVNRDYYNSFKLFIRRLDNTLIYEETFGQVAPGTNMSYQIQQTEWENITSQNPDGFYWYVGMTMGGTTPTREYYSDFIHVQLDKTDVSLGTNYALTTSGRWYKFVAPYDNVYSFQKTGSSGSIKIFSSPVYDPNNATPLYNISGAGNIQISINCGQTVYIYVSGSGSATFKIELIAQTIALGSTERNEVSEKWYKFTASTTGLYKFDTHNPVYVPDSSFQKYGSDTFIQVLDGIFGNILGEYKFYVYGDTDNPIMLHLNANQTVYIRTGDVFIVDPNYHGGNGPYHGPEYEIVISLINSAPEPHDQTISSGIDYSIPNWFSFKAPKSGTYSISEIFGYISPQIDIYQILPNGTLNLSQTKPSGNFGETYIEFYLSEGQTIYLSISQGQYDFKILYKNPPIDQLNVGITGPIYHGNGNSATLPFTALANGYYTFNISTTSAGTGKISNAYGDLFSYNQTSLTNTYRVYLSLGETVEFTYLITNGGFITVMVEQQLYTLTPNPATFGTANTIDGSYLGGKWFTFTPTETQMYFIDIEGYGSANALSLTLRKDYLNGSLVSFPFARTPNVYGGATLIAGTTYYIYMDTTGYTKSGTPSWTIKTVTDVDCGNITLNTFYGGVQQYGINNNYYFTPSVSGIYTIFRSGSNYNISVRDESGNTVSISSNRGTLTAGTSYIITFTGNVLGQSGSVSWSLMPPYTTLSLTTQYDIDYTGGKWFAFTPATTQPYFIDLYGYGFAPIVYTGNPASNNITSFPFVRYDNGYRAILTAGVTYYIYMNTTGNTSTSGAPYWTINTRTEVDCGNITTNTFYNTSTKYGIYNYYSFTPSDSGVYIFTQNGNNYNFSIKDQYGNIVYDNILYAGKNYTITFTGNSGYTGSVTWSLSFDRMIENSWYAYDAQKAAASYYKFSPAESTTYYLMITNDQWNSRAIPSITGAILKFLGQSTNGTALYSVYLCDDTTYAISFSNMGVNSSFQISGASEANSTLKIGNWGIKTHITTGNYTLYYINGFNTGKTLTLSTDNVYADIYVNGQYAGYFASANNYTADINVGVNDTVCIIVYANFDTLLTITGYMPSEYTHYWGEILNRLSYTFVPTGGGYFDGFNFKPSSSGTYYVYVKSGTQSSMWVSNSNGNITFTYMGKATDGTAIYSVSLTAGTTYLFKFEGAYYNPAQVTLKITDYSPMQDISNYSDAYYDFWFYEPYIILTYTASTSGWHTFYVQAYCDIYLQNGMSSQYLGYCAGSNSYTMSAYVNTGDTVNIIIVMNSINVPFYITTP